MGADEFRGKEKSPAFNIGASGWRILGSTGVIFGAVCLIGLVAVVALQRGDALASIALVLAIASFIVQIIVSALQNSASRAAEAAAQNLNFETNKALEQIKSRAAANQEILARQFDTLLEALVKERGHPSREDKSKDVPEEAKEQRPDFRALSRQFSRLSSEPIEDDRFAEMMRTFPSKEEAVPLLEILQGLPPTAVAMLERYASNELEARDEGSAPGLAPSDAPLAQLSRRHLVDAGLIKEKDGNFCLTNTGIQVARLFRAVDDPPENVREAMA